MTIHLRGLPGGCPRGSGRAVQPPFDLAPGGVCRADRVTPVAGALLPHRFTLTCAARRPPSAVCFLWHFPAGRPDWPLASTLPCGVPTFLDTEGRSTFAQPHRGHPADSPSTTMFPHADIVGDESAVPSRHGPNLAAMSLEARAARLAAMGRLPKPTAQDGESLSISDLYQTVDRAIKTAVRGHVWVTGEVRSVTVSSRGICYIDLVDPATRQESDRPVLRAVCWSSQWSRIRASLDRLGIVLDAGLVVRVRGEVQLYRPRGQISFIVSELDTDALLGKVAAERARVSRRWSTLTSTTATGRSPYPPSPPVSVSWRVPGRRASATSWASSRSQVSGFGSG